MTVADVTYAQETTGRAQDTGIDRREFTEFTESAMNEPQWRAINDKACDYIDGNQLSALDRQKARERGLPDITANMMQPIINVVLGMEEKSRLDWRVVADVTGDQDVSEGLSQKMKEAERESRADRVVSDAYSSQIRAGLGWVEVGKEKDPFKYWMRCTNVPRREMWWDWRDQTPTLETAVWQIRKRRYDINHICAFFPGQEQLIRAYGSGWTEPYLREATTNLELSHAFDIERSFPLADFEMRDPYRKTVLVIEIPYRRWCRGYVLRVDEDTVVELDLRNQNHLALVASGRVRPEQAVYSKVFRSIWVGPHKMSDVPYRHRRLPYIPFFGYREDQTGAPYGLGKQMISMQDEINARRNKLLHLLSAKRVVMDGDALDQKVNDIATMLGEISRADGVVVLNQNRANKDQNAFRVENNGDLSAQQMQMMEESKQALQQIVGVFNAMLGREQTAQSGVAISGLVEQATTGLAEINGNYRYSRQEVGNAILDEIREKIGGQAVQIEVGERAVKRTIILNNPVQDPETGMVLLQNDVQRSKTRLSLADVPSTPAYRQEQVRMLTEVTRAAAPEIQAAMAPFLIEMSDVGNRYDIADSVRDAMGLPPPMSQDQRAQAQEAQAVQAEETKAMQKRLLDAQIREAEAKAEKAEAEAEKIKMETGLLMQDSHAKDQEAEHKDIGLQREEEQTQFDRMQAMRENQRQDEADKREQQQADLRAIQGLASLTEEREPA